MRLIFSKKGHGRLPQKSLTTIGRRSERHGDFFLGTFLPFARASERPIGNIPPDETVKLVFNLSQDENVRGPWNEEPDFEYLSDPQPEGGLPPPPINADDEGHESRSGKPRKRRAGAAVPAA
jgi:Mn-containing catalase